MRVDDRMHYSCAPWRQKTSALDPCLAIVHLPVALRLTAFAGFAGRRIRATERKAGVITMLAPGIVAALTGPSMRPSQVSPHVYDACRQSFLHARKGLHLVVAGTALQCSKSDQLRLVVCFLSPCSKLSTCCTEYMLHHVSRLLSVTSTLFARLV